MARSNHKSWHATSPRLETLETRNLLSIFINAKPTLEVVPVGHRVRQFHGAVHVIQPTPLIITGTAQPSDPNVQVEVQIFAKDAEGNLVNGGTPLATAVPDFSGQYTATISLPSKLRRDVNILFARETAFGTLTSTLQFNPTTLSGLGGNLQIMTPVPLIRSTIVGSITTPGLATGTLSAASTPDVSGGPVVVSTGTLNNGTQTLTTAEVAVSDPVTVLIHQSQQ